MNNLYSEVGYSSLNKFGEQLCGDNVEVIYQDDKSMVMVLADGLGSGVKANILSTLTTKIISTMMANGIGVEECIETIAKTLPVCKTRGIAYSTFTVIRIIENKEAEIIQYDNPHVILLRNNKRVEYPASVIKIDGKVIYTSRIDIKEDDVFIAFSDGAVFAGVGKTLNFGWQRENIIEFLENVYDKKFSAKTLGSILLDECNRLYNGEPGDDTTVSVIKVRKRYTVNLMIGPPANREEDSRFVSEFLQEEDEHIVCGGTTSSIVAKYLNKDVETKLEYQDPDIPPIAYIEGIDLVTEGIITINKVLSNAKDYIDNVQYFTDWRIKKDGASLICQILFEKATDINFYVGRAINPAHQNPDLPISFNIKMRIVEELSDCLRKLGKRVNVKYF